MNPFELTKDPDGGGTTVRVKHDFVVLTREEEKQITEHITEILTENAKLRELVRGLWFAAQYLGMNPDGATGSGFARQMRELGMEAK